MNKPLSPSLISTAAPAANSAQLRRSVRGFTPQPVADALLHDCLQEARRAPSGANLQPGYFWQVCGARREQLSSRLQQAYAAGEQEAEDYGYFPNPLPLSLRKRQVAAAQALYGALGVERGDAAGRGAQFGRNFRFFDAPVALIITIDSGFGPGGYMDLGMAIYGLMLAAQSRGLATCAIGAMASYPGLIRDALALPATQTVVCGMALGRLVAVAARQTQVIVVTHANRLLAALEDAAAELDYQAIHLEKNLGETHIANIPASELPRWQWHER